MLKLPLTFVFLALRPTLNCWFPITRIDKKVTRASGKPFLTLFKLNITFYFKCSNVAFTIIAA